MINTFLTLKNRLSKGVPQEVINDAIKDNNWFSETTINSSVKAICDTMLEEIELKKWIQGYNFINSYNVGVIMAGNIPLVGFYDMLSVLISGSACYYKPSSKDKVLIEWVVNEIKTIDPESRVYELKDDSCLDAIIATGSDNSNRYFESRYGKLKSLYRGSRTSVAVLKKECSDEEIDLLHGDIFTYYGLGCRNVSHLYLERGFDVDRLLESFKKKDLHHKKFANNYRFQRAEKVLNNEAFLDGGYFTLQEKEAKIGLLSEITYSFFDEICDVKQELTNNDHKIQCVVTDVSDLHIRSVKFGKAQMPTLFDAPDSKDVLKFVEEIGK
ncbi:MAG: acyl-CoA reductase [Rikenellaceae bacterium]